MLLYFLQYFAWRHSLISHNLLKGTKCGLYMLWDVNRWKMMNKCVFNCISVVFLCYGRFYCTDQGKSFDTDQQLHVIPFFFWKMSGETPCATGNGRGTLIVNQTAWLWHLGHQIALIRMRSLCECMCLSWKTVCFDLLYFESYLCEVLKC